MIKFISKLFALRDPEVQVLKEQLEYERARTKELTETLLSIIKPKVYESAPQELAPVINSSALFSKRRAAMEARDREEAKIIKQHNNLGRTDKEIQKSKELEKLEQELKIEAEKESEALEAVSEGEAKNG